MLYSLYSTLKQCLEIININSLEEIGTKAINRLDEYLNMIKSLDNDCEKIKIIILK